jgi:hypothetical protein
MNSNDLEGIEGFLRISINFPKVIKSGKKGIFEVILLANCIQFAQLLNLNLVLRTSPRKNVPRISWNSA